MKKYKWIIGLLLVTILGGMLAGCGSTDGPESTRIKAEGTWLAEDGITGYEFSELELMNNGEKMGNVQVLPDKNYSFFAISFYYRIVEKNKIEIIRCGPSFSGGGVGASKTQYDVLRLEEQDGKRVLISEQSGECYYYQESNRSLLVA